MYFKNLIHSLCQSLILSLMVIVNVWNPHSSFNIDMSSSKDASILSIQSKAISQSLLFDVNNESILFIIHSAMNHVLMNMFIIIVFYDVNHVFKAFNTLFMSIIIFNSFINRAVHLTLLSLKK